MKYWTADYTFIVMFLKNRPLPSSLLLSPTLIILLIISTSPKYKPNISFRVKINVRPGLIFGKTWLERLNKVIYWSRSFSLSILWKYMSYFMLKNYVSHIDICFNRHIYIRYILLQQIPLLSLFVRRFIKVDILFFPRLKYLNQYAPWFPQAKPYLRTFLALNSHPLPPTQLMTFTYIIKNIWMIWKY